MIKKQLLIELWHKCGKMLLKVRKFFEAIKKSIARILEYEVMPVLYRVLGNNLTSGLKKYENIHYGKRIFILATGPSLQKEDIKKLQDEITIGVNGIVSLYQDIGFKPTYYCVNDHAAVEMYKDKIIEANMQHVFWGRSCKKYEKSMNFQPIYYETVIRGSRLPFSIERTRKNMRFHKDIYKYGIYGGGRSIVCNAIQIAAYMGASEIVLYAQDCDYTGEKNHFNNQYCKSNNESMLESLFAFFECAKKYAEENNIRILNATRGGKLEIFDRVKFDDLVADK